MPFAIAGLGAVAYWPRRSPPDAREQGNGEFVGLVLLLHNGERRSVRLRKIEKPDEQWRHELSPDAFAITRRKATEFAFSNRYWNSHASGVYRCVCCGTALFSSQAKFDSGTGWPSFTDPIARENVALAKDNSLPEERTEVLCAKCDAHLGHLFADGPPPTGLRYCLNSGALQLSES